MHRHPGAGVPSRLYITGKVAICCLVLGVILMLAFYLFWPKEVQAAIDQGTQPAPAPARVRPAQQSSGPEQPAVTTTVGGDWRPSSSQRWRSFEVCRDYGTDPVPFITASSGPAPISQCNLAANLATRNQDLTEVFGLLLTMGGVRDDPARLFHKCQVLILPLLDDWSYLSNAAQFDHQATKPYIQLALRCQVLVRQGLRPDPRPGQTVMAFADQVMTPMR